MASKMLQDSDLLILLKRRFRIYRELLQLSQRQFAESNPTAWNWLLDRKQELIDELQQMDDLQAAWEESHDRQRNPEEAELLEHTEALLERVRDSEEEFEKRILHDKNLVSHEMEQLGKQMNYSSPVRNYVKGRSKHIS